MKAEKQQRITLPGFDCSEAPQILDVEYTEQEYHSELQNTN